MQGIYSHWLTISQLDHLNSAANIECYKLTNEKVQEYLLVFKENLEKALSEFLLWRNRADRATASHFIAWILVAFFFFQLIKNSTEIQERIQSFWNHFTECHPPWRMFHLPGQAQHQESIYFSPRLFLLLSGDKLYSLSWPQEGETFRLFNQWNTRLFFFFKTLLWRSPIIELDEDCVFLLKPGTLRWPVPFIKESQCSLTQS